ncbi:MAG: hypothetical protein HUU55_10025 [Myxococcales bacterium]|nr:hypothetical protein [Myxococcales bacterium]
MAGKQLFKRDDILIRIGIPLLLVSFLVLVGSVHDTWSFLVALLFALAPIGLLIAGGYYRYKERRILALWRIIEQTAVVRMDDLVAGAGFRRTEVLEALRILNSRKNLYFVHDGATDTILDGRLRHQHAHETRCLSCGASVKLSVADWTGPPTCGHCGASVVPPDWKRLRDEVMASLRRPGVVTVTPAESFNLPVFVLLVVFCWPAALIYYAVKNRVR